jgi:hypothetical protein
MCELLLTASYDAETIENKIRIFKLMTDILELRKNSLQIVNACDSIIQFITNFHLINTEQMTI